jgi:hypothetical protein
MNVGNSIKSLGRFKWGISFGCGDSLFQLAIFGFSPMVKNQKNCN